MDSGKNIQTQTWTITFDADVIPYHSLGKAIGCLRGIIETNDVPVEQECKNMVSICESLNLAIEKFIKHAEKFKDNVDPKNVY